MTISEMIRHLDGILKDNGDGPVVINITPTHGAATSQDTRILEAEKIDWALTGGAEITAYDTEWKP